MAVKKYGGATRRKEIIWLYPSVAVIVGKKLWQPMAPIMHILMAVMMYSFLSSSASLRPSIRDMLSSSMSLCEASRVNRRIAVAGLVRESSPLCRVTYRLLSLQAITQSRYVENQAE